GMVRTARPDEASTRDTLRSSRFATHREPAPEATATGRAPTGTTDPIEPDELSPTIELGATDGCEPPRVARRTPATVAAATRTATAMPPTIRRPPRRRGTPSLAAGGSGGVVGGRRAGGASSRRR